MTNPDYALSTGVRAFAGDYDLFIVDQWGVLHEGQAAYPGAVDCLRRLLALGKRVVILSNSGKRSAINARRLWAMGIDESYYTSLITSGEVARERLATRSAPFLPSLGRRCLLLGSSDEDSSLVEGLDMDLVPTVSDADFMLLAGVGDENTLAFYQPILDYGRAHGIPLVCANPDLVRLSPRGLLFSAGELARCYARMGGIVHYIGKPYPAIYDYCARVVPGFEPSRAVAIGDSFFHDVVGGAGFGLATALVTDGIHKADFADTARLSETVEDMAREFGARPNWVIRQFRW